MAKSTWQRRQEVIESLDLSAAAAEINAARMRALRHAALEEPGAPVPDRLPSGHAAEPTRMRAALEALHKLLGTQAEAVVRVADLAKKMNASIKTCRRAVRDLEDTHLVAVRRRRGYGGKHPSAYRIVHATLVDLALAQGLQGRLFDTPAARQTDRSPPGDPSTGHGDPSTGHGDPSTGHGDPSTGHGDPLGYSRARVPSGTRSGTNKEPPPPPSGGPPAHRDGVSDRTEEGGGGGGVNSSVEEAGLDHQCPADQAPPYSMGCPPEGGWERVTERLERYGFRSGRRVVRRARRKGLRRDDVDRLIEHCEQARIGGLAAWGPGAIVYALEAAERGDRLPQLLRLLPTPAEAYRRRRAEQQLRPERRAAQPGPSPLEAQYGAQLDRLPEQDLEALAERAFRSAFERRLWRRQGLSPMMRPRLLEQIAAEVAAKSRTR